MHSVICICHDLCINNAVFSRYCVSRPLPSAFATSLYSLCTVTRYLCQLAQSARQHNGRIHFPWPRGRSAHKVVTVQKAVCSTAGPCVCHSLLHSSATDMARGWYRDLKNFTLTLTVTVILDIVIAKGLPNKIAKSSHGISEEVFHKAPLEKEKEVVYTEDILMNDGLPVAENVAETVRLDNGLTLTEDYLLFPGLKGVLPASVPREGRRPGSRTSGNRTFEYK